jgi:endonuclease/exonuclease/phosphatase (EEP) superfamily protein YafD
VAFSVVTVVVRERSLTNIIALLIAIGTPYIPLLALSALALAMLCRRLFLSLVAALVGIAAVGVQAHWYYVGHAPDVEGTTDIRVLSSNLRRGQADARNFVDLAKESADVLTVSELTPDSVERFLQAGIGGSFPYSVLFPAPGAGGIGIWSRFPLTEVASAKQLSNVAARVQVPDVRLNPLVASMHVMSPLSFDTDSFDYWERDIATAKAELENFAKSAGPGAVIVAGDFNSTPDMSQFRDLSNNGYLNAAQQTGSGFAPTFPSNKPFPPLITIDHVLTRNAAASSIETTELPGSDHRSLLATIKVPLDPTAP